MPSVFIKPVNRFNGHLSLPGDKSIAHRALIFAALADGETELFNLPDSFDIRSTIQCLEGFGIKISVYKKCAHIFGKPLNNWKIPNGPLNAGNAGTTARLMMAVSSLFPFTTEIEGDLSLSKRPMGYLAEELKKFGSDIQLTNGDELPAKISGGDLRACEAYVSKNSAQFKTALIIASLFSEGTSVIKGKLASRDHSERMLESFGVNFSTQGGSLQELISSYVDHPEKEYEISITGKQKINPFNMTIPGDPSSAAFFHGAAALIKNAKVKTLGLSINPTRIGFLRVLKRMGAHIHTDILEQNIEPIGDLTVKNRWLKGVEIYPQEVPFLVDEIPLLAVLAAFSEGKTTVRGAAELRHKETDRIKSLASNFKSLGVSFTEFDDGFEIIGQEKIEGGTVDSFGDHRIAMAFSVAALNSEKGIELKNSEAMAVSYPKFMHDLKGCTHV
jgi:3-phosphoshikimate 1-carboxyvinyltransferase